MFISSLVFFIAPNLWIILAFSLSQIWNSVSNDWYFYPYFFMLYIAALIMFLCLWHVRYFTKVLLSANFINTLLEDDDGLSQEELEDG